MALARRRTVRRKTSGAGPFHAQKHRSPMNRRAPGIMPIELTQAREQRDARRGFGRILEGLKFRRAA